MPEQCPVCFATRSASPLYQAIQTIRNPPFDKFLYALGIHHVGQHVAQVLARTFHHLDSLQQASKTNLQQVPEIGPEIAPSEE